MATAVQPFVGIYSPPTAARLLLASRDADEVYPVSSRTLVRWAHNGLVTPGLAQVRGREIILTFEDLISLRVIAALRAAKVTWQTIRNAEQWLRSTISYPRPFAREELWTTRSDVFTRFKGMLISASSHGQLAMDIIVDYLIPVSGISFDEQIARKWEPRDLIVLDPKVQFGEPCIKGTRIPAQSIASMIRSGDPEKFVMASYGISSDELRAALDWAERVAA